MIECGSVRRAGISHGSRRQPAETEGSACRALVAVSPVKPREHVVQRPAARSSAAFLAHLIATAADHPQTREKRRLAPEDAARLYVAAQENAQPKRAHLASL